MQYSQSCTTFIRKLEVEFLEDLFFFCLELMDKAVGLDQIVSDMHLKSILFLVVVFIAHLLYMYFRIF